MDTFKQAFPIKLPPKIRYFDFDWKFSKICLPNFFNSAVVQLGSLTIIAAVE